MSQTSQEIRNLRNALGTFLTGVTVVTRLDQHGRPLGFTANSFTSVSLEPPLVLVCMSKGSQNFGSYLHTEHFAVNVLAEHQRGVSTTFATPNEDRFRDVDWGIGTTGSPILEQVVAWFDCETHEVVDAGDHIILIGRVVDYAHNDLPPLGYLRGNYVHFELEQTAAAAMENPALQTRVGALIEYHDGLLLVPDGDNLGLPTAAQLGHQDDPGSLNGIIEAYGVQTKTQYLFAVFENKKHKTSDIYYRGEATRVSRDAGAHFYPLEDIPFDRIQDGVVVAMIRRYIHERSLNAYGIYVGDEYSGVIELLGKAS